MNSNPDEKETQPSITQKAVSGGAPMKRAVTVYAFIAVVLSMTSLTANGASDFHLGTISASTLGSSVTTTLPMFNSALGTLTGVQVTLDFTVTPYAQILNFSGAPRTFTPSDSVSHSYSPSPANIWTISHGTDSWTLAAPTVTTGPIYGTGQVVPNFTSLQFVGSTSAPVDLTAASGLDLAAYIGAGSLVFGTGGPGQSSGTGPFFSGGGGAGGGANLAGTASVTYEYAPVPEPGTFALMVCGLTGLLVMRRRSAMKSAG
jgi:uncharacterized membrane protein YgcG